MYCRKNFIDLTVEERDRLAAAFNDLYSKGQITAYANEHGNHFDHGIHWGPAFLPWHRYFLLTVERELKKTDARIFLPYWDWTRADSRNLDAEPWKSFFGGRNNTGGRFDHWSYTRALTPPPNSAPLPSLDNVIDELQASTFAGYRRMECGSHAPGHTWTGGTMAGGQSPLDPLFYLHHCNVDRLWAIWQRNHPGAEQYTLDDTNCPRRVDAAFVPLNDPMIGGATPASMLNHTALSYFYPNDDLLESRARDRGLPAIVSGDVTNIVLETSQVIFNDVPEGDTTKRAILFRVSGCKSVTFHITSGPTGPFSLFAPGPFTFPAGSFPNDQLRIWVMYTGRTPGSSDSGVISVVARNAFGDEVQRWENIPILANSVARPRVAVALVLDESGSMLLPAGNNRTRLEVLKWTANTFIDRLYDDNGLTMVSFADTAKKLTDLQIVGPLNSSVRANARTKIRDHGPPGLYPTTSIGAGLQIAANEFNTSPNAADFDIKATIVFTDGFENTAPFIHEVSSLINDRVYAVGMADAANVKNDTLRSLANNTGGYMLVTGAVAQDDEFLLQKFFIQILAGVLNRNMVRDPAGWLIPGQIVRVPFTITRSDIDFDAAVLSRAPNYIVIGLETPDGTVVDPSQLPADSFRPGKTSTGMRIMLPLVIDDKEHWEGEWNLLLSFQWGVGISSTTALTAATGFSQLEALPFHALVHARSNLHLRAYIDQSALTPGAQIHLKAVLTEYGQPLETRPQVKAAITHPDGTGSELVLSETGHGEFEASVTAHQSGVYRFYVQAAGLSSHGQAFTREQLLTVVVGHLSHDPGTSPENTILCKLLKCLFSKDVMTERFDRKLGDLGIDWEQLKRCVACICGSHDHNRAPDDLIK